MLQTLLFRIAQAVVQPAAYRQLVIAQGRLRLNLAQRGEEACLFALAISVSRRQAS